MSAPAYSPPRHRRRRAALDIFAAGALLSVLAGVGPTAPRADARPPSPEQDVTPLDSLRLRVDFPEEVKAGAPLPVTLIAENVTEQVLDLYLTGRPIAFDLIVTDEVGDVVWRRLEGEVIAMVLRIETLAPGAVLELTDRWDQRTNEGDPVPPGSYAVRGRILTEGEPLTTPSRTLRIVP